MSQHGVGDGLKVSASPYVLVLFQNDGRSSTGNKEFLLFFLLFLLFFTYENKIISIDRSLFHRFLLFFNCGDRPRRYRDVTNDLE